MPLYGRPMLSMIVSISLGRDLRADRLLDLIAQPRGLLDARPGRRAHVQPNWPLSTAGKKSWPSHGTIARTEATQNAEHRQEQQPAMVQAPRRARRGSGRAGARSRARTGAGSAPADCGVGPRLVRVADLVPAQQVLAPSSARACATAGTTPASRTRPPRRAARTGTARRRSARTSARTRCRSTASRRTRAPRSARRRRGSPARSV